MAWMPADVFRATGSVFPWYTASKTAFGFGRYEFSPMRTPAAISRPVYWIGSSLTDLRAMPEAVQKRIGRTLQVAQFGGRPKAATPLLGFGGASVLEIRDDFDTDTYRCIYTVRYVDAICVLHAFQKKSRTGIRASKSDIELIRTRLARADELMKDVRPNATE